MDIPPDAPSSLFETTQKVLVAYEAYVVYQSIAMKYGTKKAFLSVKGHGFHIGGTTHLLLLGVNPWIVMVQGHWSSKRF